MAFLYWILGWRYVPFSHHNALSHSYAPDFLQISSFVGLAVMGALIPVPARVTRSMGSVQRE